MDTIYTKKFVHLLYCPWTGLGLYGGFRGNRWLKNRLQIFKQFVVPSLQNQINKNFVLWCTFRPEEKNNPRVKELMAYMSTVREFKTVFSFHGLLFWDDKYPDEIARDRLLTNLHNTLGEMTDVIGECEYVYMTIQPSDDCYRKDAVQGIQGVFEKLPEFQAFGFAKGYIMNYRTNEVAEYNPATNPPFFTIKFPRDVFIDPLKHAEYTGPYKSHEYVGDHLKYGVVQEERGFLVGTHGENISTHFRHPFAGRQVEGIEKEHVLWDFGLLGQPPLRIAFSLRRRVLRLLPHSVQRKIRYWFGECLWQRIYEFLRS